MEVNDCLAEWNDLLEDFNKLQVTTQIYYNTIQIIYRLLYPYLTVNIKINHFNYFKSKQLKFEFVVI